MRLSFGAGWKSYRSFRSTGRDDFWNEHSVQIPFQLAGEHSDEIQTLPHDAFYWPLWHDEHLDWMFNSNDPIPSGGTYANHLWETLAWDFVADLRPGAVRARNSNFCRWVRPYVADLPDDFGAT